MQHSNMRRRVVAALAAGGLATLGGIARARAQTSVAAVPCQVSSTEGTLENMQPNYWATATRVEFVFLARMRAVADGVLLYATEFGGEIAQAVAGIKAVATRDESGTLQVEQMQIHWPLTVLKHEGQLYSIIQMAHDQGVPVGLSLSAGGNPLGDILFAQGAFDPNQPVVGFDAPTSASIHQGLMRNEGFSARLMAGGVVYSTVEPDTAKYSSFISQTLAGAMDEAKRRDAEDPCTYVDPATYDDYLDGLEDCFLTSACCTVIGLEDRCWELETLRRFRDGWLSSFAAGRADIARYYREAPAVAQRLVSSATGRRQLLGLYWGYIVPSAVLARIGANRAAHALYRRMMLDLLGPQSD